MIDVNTPIIYINDYDFVRIDELIRKVVGGKKVVEWNPVTGDTDFCNKETNNDIDLADFLKEKYTLELPECAPKPEDSFIVLKEIQDYIDIIKSFHT